MKRLRSWREILTPFCLALSVLLFCLAALTGCQREGGAGGSSQEEIYTLPEVMLIVATERNRYQQVYTSQIWSAVVDENGTTMEDLLLEQIRTFLEDLEVMNRLAQSRGLEVSSAERDQVYQLSQEFYDSLSEADLAYTGASGEDVRSLYERYYLANKVVDELTGTADLEISDSEAKVIHVQQIVLDSREEAEEVYSLVTAEDADFAAAAKEYSPDSQIDRTLGKGEAESAYEEAAFSLEEGQISPVTESGGKYYIIKCTSAFDEEATQERKSRLSLARKEQAFRSIYDQFKEENPVELPDELWAQVSFDGGEGSETAVFFDLYREYFPE